MQKIFKVLPPLIGGFFYLALITSCTSQSNQIGPEYRAVDNVDHYISLANDYIEFNKSTVREIYGPSRTYLRNIFNRISSSNEILIGKIKHGPRFYSVKSKRPFYFSFPGNYYFFSTALLGKYVLNEGQLISLMTFEMIRSQRNIYSRNFVVPTGFLDEKRMLYLARIPQDIRNNINKWTYHSLKRAGEDPEALLSWIQFMNKNSVDFFMQVGDLSNISKEEYVFKIFLTKIREKKSVKLSNTSTKRRSIRFYNFVKRFGKGRQ